MKIAYLSIGLLSLLTPLSAAWSKEDREIFRIRDEISAHEADPLSNFYDILGVSQSASWDDINKAYRKKTVSLHPDKVKQQIKREHAKVSKANEESGGKAVKPLTQAEIKSAVRQASDRQTRLSLIVGILRGPARDRYDHFLSNGFPLWKGTDYYYNRYRPGLGTAIIGVFIVGGGAIHYLALYMSWKRQKEFVERYVKFARDTAWGGGMGIPGIETEPVPAPAPVVPEEEGGPQQPMNRRQRRMQDKETKKDDGRVVSKKSRKAQNSSREASTGPPTPSGGPTGAKKRVIAENGKVLIVDSRGDVFLEGRDEDNNIQEFLLDPNELAEPTIRDTAIVRVPLWFFNMSIGRFLPQGGSDGESFAGDGDFDSDIVQHTPSSDSAGEDFEMLDKSTDSLAKVKATGAQQGGRSSKRKNKKR